jgi:hypothetical protein
MALCTDYSHDGAMIVHWDTLVFIGARTYSLPDFLPRTYGSMCVQRRSTFAAVATTKPRWPQTHRNPTRFRLIFMTI